MIKEIKGSRKLSLELDGGIDGDRQLIKSKVFPNINLESKEEDIYVVATSLANLQVLDLIKVKKVEETILIEE